MSERRNQGVLKASERLDLSNRLALRVKEAAEALGLGERTVRQILPELPHLRAGGVVLLPVDGLRAWLQEQAEAEKGRVDAVAEEVLKVVSGGSV